MLNVRVNSKVHEDDLIVVRNMLDRHIRGFIFDCIDTAPLGNRHLFLSDFDVSSSVTICAASTG